ncbi:MAG: hypothetical protein WCI21_06480 [Alphaproteobacteria bacterium]
MLRLILFRAALIALPILVWSFWAEVARRRGKPLRATPWIWLLTAGLAMAAASLLIAGLVGSANPPDTSYVPVESGPGGAVVSGPR